jgi:hypothetical protein
MSDEEKIIGTAIAGIVGLKLLDTSLKMIDHQKKKVKKKGWI